MNIIKNLLKINNHKDFFDYFILNRKKLKKINYNDLLKLESKLSKFLIDKEICNLVLNGYQEINKVNDKNIKYYTILVNNELKKKSMYVYFYFYYILSKFVKKLYLPLDFEFNTKKVALMQANFETNFNNRFIFIFYPPDLSNYWLSVLIKKILGNKNILKILHGSDSLDIPYVLSDLITKKKYQEKFLYSFIDTKFFCEYYNYDNDLDRKCKIYQFLKDQKIITNKKLEELYANEENMGHIYDIFIDVNNISQPLLLYTLYDVIFLKYLYLVFPLENKIYKRLIPELTQVVFMERREVNDTFKIINESNNKQNNYFYIKNNKKIKMIETYNKILNSLPNDIYKFNVLFKINYFKKLLKTIIKYILYFNINKNYIVYKKKNTENIDTSNLDSLYNTNLNEFNKLLDYLINNIKYQVNNKL